VEENEVQRFLENNLRAILSACMGYNGPYVSKPQFILKNGIQTDLGVIDNSGKIIALFESKGDVNINELVRGIGQLMQYQYHIDQNIGYDYLPTAKAFLVTPKTVIDRYNFEYLSFPQNSGIILIDGKMGTFLLQSKKRKNTGKLKKTEIISPYYIRDNRLGEIYLGLKIVEAISPKTLEGKVNMKAIKNQLVKVIKNKGNARNIPISLHGLGFLGEENRLTAEGQRHVRMDYFEFCKNLSYDHLVPFFNLIMTALTLIANKKKIDYSSITTSASEIKKEILKIFNGNDVLYVTQSKTRYISSWMSILKEDLGAISFKAGNYQGGIKINYFPNKGCPFLMRQMPVSADCRDYDYIVKGLEVISKL